MKSSAHSQQQVLTATFTHHPATGVYHPERKYNIIFYINIGTDTLFTFPANAKNTSIAIEHFKSQSCTFPHSANENMREAEAFG